MGGPKARLSRKASAARATCDLCNATRLPSSFARLHTVICATAKTFASLRSPPRGVVGARGWLRQGGRRGDQQTGQPGAVCAGALAPPARMLSRVAEATQSRLRPTPRRPSPRGVCPRGEISRASRPEARLGSLPGCAYSWGALSSMQTQVGVALRPNQ